MTARRFSFSNKKLRGIPRRLRALTRWKKSLSGYYPSQLTSVALADIRIILSPSDESALRGGIGPMALLEKRLLGLSQEVERIRTQQRLLAHLLAAPDIRNGRQHWDKASWVAKLRRAGFDEEAMHLWHVEFEREDPDEHANFLALLGLTPAEVAEIRRWSKAAYGEQTLRNSP